VIWALLMGCAPPSLQGEALVSTFEALHAPLYEAWEVDDDAARWDLLARSWTGEALTTAYVEQTVAREAMTRADQAVRVIGVQYGEVVPLDDDGEPGVDAVWWVRGIVRHQAHSHARIQQYRAVYRLADTPDGWRLASGSVRDMARVSSQLDAADLFGDEGAQDPTAAGFMDPLELLSGQEAPP
jgi:hypothetical protein